MNYKQSLYKETNKLIAFCSNFIVYFLLILFGFLSISGLFLTSYFENYSEVMLYKGNNLILSVIFLISFLGILVYSQKNIFHKINTNILINLLITYSFLFGVTWIFMVNSHPYADQAEVNAKAQAFIHSDYSSLDTGGYMFIYPFQLGITFLFETIYRIIGEGSYQYLQMLNVICTIISFYILILISKMMFKNKNHTIITIILLFGCLPPLFFSIYVYGNLIGLMFSLLATLFLLKYLKTRKLLMTVPIFFFMWCSLVVKSNYKIVLIAFCIILLLDCIKFKKLLSLVLLLLLLLLQFTALKPIFNYYEHQSGKNINEGMPSSVWVAMGMMEGIRAPGWYNEWAWHTYADANYNYEITSDIAKHSIKESLSNFKSNPQYAIKFYYKKIVSQWLEPTYESIWVSHDGNQHDKPLSKITQSVYDGKLNLLLLYFMKSYQLILYFGIFLFCLLHARKIEFYKLTLALVVMGGFLFHIIWEGNSRFILPYFVIMVPYSAAGFGILSEKILQALNHNKYTNTKIYLINETTGEHTKIDRINDTST